MPGYAPQNSYQNQQTYLAINATDSTIDTGPLAAPTGSYVYKKGSLMAKYTSGPNSGQYVNYVAAGSTGQNVCVGILQSDELSDTQATDGGETISVQLAGMPGLYNFLEAELDVMTSGDITTGMTAMFARRMVINGIAEWHLP